MKSLKRYSWIIDFSTAALLLALGIIFIFESKVVMFFMGFIFLIFATTRVIPLLKTTNDKMMKWIMGTEILIEIVAGIILFILGMKVEAIGKEFGYIVGAVLYIRGFVHFLATSLRGEPSSFLGFAFHIVLLTVGVLLFTNGNINSKTMSICIAVLLFICVILQVYRGIKGYRNYRVQFVSEFETKKLKRNKKEEKLIEVPTSDEIIINIPDDNNKIENDINA